MPWPAAGGGQRRSTRRSLTRMKNKSARRLPAGSDEVRVRVVVGLTKLPKIPHRRSREIARFRRGRPHNICAMKMHRTHVKPVPQYVHTRGAYHSSSCQARQQPEPRASGHRQAFTFSATHTSIERIHARYNSPPREQPSQADAPSRSTHRRTDAPKRSTSRHETRE